jgi:hypothetical protein
MGCVGADAASRRRSAFNLTIIVFEGRRAFQHAIV